MGARDRTEAMSTTDNGASRAGAGDDAGVFLSPRVVDASAFEEFARALRELIGQAQGESTALRAASGVAERTGEDLAKAITRAKGRLDTLAKASERLGERLESLEARVAQRERTPSHPAPAPAPAPVARADHADVARLSARLEALERRLTEQETRATNHAPGPEAIERTLAEHDARASSMEQRLDTLRRSTQGELDRAREAWNEIASDIERRLDGEDGAATINARLVAASDQGEAVRATLTRLMDEAQRRAADVEAVVVRTGATIGESVADAERAHGLLTEVMDSLGAAHDKAEQERRRLEAGVMLLGEQSSRLEAAIASWRDADEVPDAVETRLASFRDEVGRTLGAMQDLVAELVARAQA